MVEVCSLEAIDLIVTKSGEQISQVNTVDSLTTIRKPEGERYMECYFEKENI